MSAMRPPALPGREVPAFVDRAILISGSPRSGTNLLHRLLSGHPNVLAMPDTGKANIIRAMPEVWAADPVRPQMARDLAAAAEFLAAGPAEELEQHQRLMADWIGHRPAALRAWVASFLIAHAARRGAAPETLTHWAEKNHNLEFHVHQARALFGEFRLVFMLRDPRDAWASWDSICRRSGLDTGPRQYRKNVLGHLKLELALLEAGCSGLATRDRIAEAYQLDRAWLDVALEAEGDMAPYPPDTDDLGPPGYFARNWQQMLRRAERNRKLDPRRCTILRYEDLVQDPAGRMRELSGWFGLEFHQALLSVDATPSPTWERILPGSRGNSSFVSREPGKVDACSVGLGRKMLPADQSQQIEAVAGREMARHGYGMANQ